VNTVNPNIFTALTAISPPSSRRWLLGAVACVLFPGRDVRANRNLWGGVALAGLIAAGIGLWRPPAGCRPSRRGARGRDGPAAGRAGGGAAGRRGGPEREVYAGPVQHTRLALLIKLIAIVGGVVLVLCTWDDMPADQAADYHACLLIIIAGIGITGAPTTS